MDKTRKIISNILTVIIIACMVIAAFLLFQEYRENAKHEELMESLQSTSESTAQPTDSAAPDDNTSAAPDASDSSTSAGTESEGSNADSSSPSPEENSMENPMETSTENPMENPMEVAIPRIPNPYAEQFLANEDMAGWLTIPGTQIDYPVMWTPRDENYYLYRDFDHSENKNGSLILDTDSCVDPLSTNLIIHGHNMRSGAMFGDLTDYESEAYCKEHNIITLHTKECARNYEVIATFRSQVYRKSDQVFKFYKFFQADTPEEFDDFYKNIKELSQYDTGVTAEFGDRFITLSTCVYHVENGRFVVVAKEIEPGDYYEPIHEGTDDPNQEEENT